jgi:hypothetical protein
MIFPIPSLGMDHPYVFPSGDRANKAKLPQLTDHLFRLERP